MSKFMSSVAVMFVYWWTKVKEFFAKRFRKIRGFVISSLGGDANAKWVFLTLGKYTLFVLAFALYTVVLCRSQYAKASKAYSEYYEAWYQDQMQIYVASKEAEEAALEAQRNAEPTEEQIRRVQAEELARLLYGVKDNSTDDLRTLCWCVFNRVDNRIYPSTIEEVISQPSQWIGYSHSNVVLEDLYQIAYEEMTKWQADSHRPVSNEYVFMSWSASGIVLRNTFNETAATRYWRMR